MNKIILLGRLTRDPEIKKTENTGTDYVKFDLAVDRKYKTNEISDDVDFIPIVAWAKQAEIICKYLKKGDCITLSGRLCVSTYKDKDGNNKHSTNVILEEFRFVNTNSKKQENIQ